MNWESHLCLFISIKWKMSFYFNYQSISNQFKSIYDLFSFFDFLISDLIVSFILYWMFRWMIEFGILISFLFSINIAFLIDLIIDWFMREISLLSFLISFFSHSHLQFHHPCSMTSNQARLPAEFKHITKQRKRN